MSWELWWQIALLIGWVGFVCAFVKNIDSGKGPGRDD